MKKYYYKVVSIDKNQNLTSFLHGKRSIVYIPNRWVKPRNNRYTKGGPLAVFDRLENAENFEKYSIQIWRCEIKKSKLKSLFCEYKYKNKNKNYCDIRKLTNLPMGTILADQVKLIERIY